MISKEIVLTAKKSNSNDISEEELLLTPDNYFLKITVLDILEMSDNVNILDFVCSKIRKKGKIILNGIDFLDFSRRCSKGEITNEQASSYIRNMNNVNSLASLKDYFANKKWNIQFLGLKDGRYFVEAINE